MFCSSHKRNNRKDNTFHSTRYPPLKMANNAYGQTLQGAANGVLRRGLTSDNVASNTIPNHHIIKDDPDGALLSVDEKAGIGMIGAEVRRFPVCRMFSLPLLSGNTCVLHKKDTEDELLTRLGPRSRTAFIRTPSEHINAAFLPRHNTAPRNDCVAATRKYSAGTLVCRDSRTRSSNYGSTPNRQGYMYVDQTLDIQNHATNNKTVCHTPESGTHNAHYGRNVPNNPGDMTINLGGSPSERIVQSVNTHAVIVPNSRPSSPTEYVLSWLRNSESPSLIDDPDWCNIAIL